MQQQNWNQTARILATSLQYEPAEIRNLGPGDPCRSGEEAQLASLYATVHGALTEDLQRASDTAAAGRDMNRVTELENASRRFLDSRRQD